MRLVPLIALPPLVTSRLLPCHPLFSDLSPFSKLGLTKSRDKSIHGGTVAHFKWTNDDEILWRQGSRLPGVRRFT